jgi:hypothetical protein
MAGLGGLGFSQPTATGHLLQEAAGAIAGAGHHEQLDLYSPWLLRTSEENAAAGRDAPRL